MPSLLHGKIPSRLLFLYWMALTTAHAGLLWSPPRGTPGDLWADIVLGQTDGPVGGGGVVLPNFAFGEVKPNQATNRSIFNVGGVFIDRSSTPQRLFIWDGGNSRVLGFSDINRAIYSDYPADTQLCLGSDPSRIPAGADIVLGQPDFSHCACNGDGNYQDYPLLTPPNASELCGTAQALLSIWEGGSYSNMAADSKGNLYVPDALNNRVLRFETSALVAGAAGPAASYVWGQGDFTSDLPNQGFSAPSAGSLNLGTIGGAGIDPWGNLWVADAYNNRVLRFPNPNAPGPGIPSTTADVVLGQPSFYSFSAGKSATQLTYPNAVRVDSNGNVFISEVNGGIAGRVLVFKPSSFAASGVPQYTNGMAASGILSSGVNDPFSLDLLPDAGNPALDDLWVTDVTYNQVVMFTVDCSATSPVFTAKKVLLQHQLSTAQAGNANSGDGPNFLYAFPPWNDTAASYFMFGPYASAVDKDGNVFICVKSDQHDLWRFPAPIPDLGTLPAGEAHSADVNVFKQSASGMKNQMGPNNLEEGLGVAVAQLAPTPQIVVSDDYRLLYWNMPGGGPAGITNGQAPDGYAGTYPADVYNGGLTYFSRVATDQASPTQHLYACANENGPEGVQIYNLPLSPYALPATFLTSPLAVLGGGNLTLSAWLDDAQPDPTGTYLWLADRGNSRVLRVRNPLTAPVVDVILGQTSASGTQCNQGLPNPTASTLCNPGAVALDHHGNLYVSDAALETAGNWRMLRWNASQFPPSPTTCLFAVPAAGVFATGGSFTIADQCQSPDSIAECAPFKPAFTSDDRIMVAGQNGYTGNRFPVVFQNPAQGDNPVTTISDWSSMTYSAAFDKQDNLYLTDLDRARMFVYYQPFPSPTPTPTGTLTPPPTLSPTPVPTASCWQSAGYLPTPPSGFGYPYSMAVDPARNYLYISDPGNHRIDVYTYSHSSLPVFQTSFGNSSQMPGLNDIGIDSLGYLYGADGNGWVTKYSFNGSTYSALVTFGAADGIGSPRGIYVDPTGNTVYVASGSGTIYRYDWNGSTYTKTASFGAGTGIPTGVFKSGNNIYVVDSSNNRVLMVTETPGAPPTYGALTVVNLNAGSGIINNPFYIKDDGNGHFFVSSANNGQLLVFNAASPTNFNLLYDPGFSDVVTGFTEDNYGNFYISQSNTNEVLEMRGCLASPTPSPTVTSTATLTPTGTTTGTPTATPTPTLTGTPTFTASPTATSTASFTASATPSPTVSSTFTSSPTATPSSTPTASPTATVTSTVTSTPTEGCHDPGFYPNPCSDTLHVHFSPCDQGREVYVKIFTVVDRKVLDKDIPHIPIGTDFSLELKDDWDRPLANGLYYLVIDGAQGRSIGKLLILR